jgi:hypothetical protein
LKHLPVEICQGGPGRPRGQRQSLAELANRWYLMWISEKYGLEAHKFLTSFKDTWTKGKSSCKDISVQCRQKTENNAVFLVTQGQEIIAQLSLSETALKCLSEIDLTCYPWNQFPLAKTPRNPLGTI